MHSHFKFKDRTLNALTLIGKRLTRMEHKMTNLQESIDELTEAVAGVASRIDAGTEPLQTALAAANEALAVLMAEDVIEDEALAAAQAQLSAALTYAQAAADSIAVQSGVLNSLANLPAEPEEGEDPAPEEGDPAQPVLGF